MPLRYTVLRVLTVLRALAMLRVLTVLRGVLTFRIATVIDRAPYPLTITISSLPSRSTHGLREAQVK